MSHDIESLVRRLISDHCTGCKDECELCNYGPCDYLVMNIGYFFVNWAIDEFEERTVGKENKEQ